MSTSRAIIWSITLCSALALLTPPCTAGEKSAAGESDPASITGIPLANILAASREVDEFIETGYADNSVEPNPLANRKNAEALLGVPCPWPWPGFRRH